MTKGQDVWQKSFYERAIQTSIGSALRAQYDLSEPLPERLADLLRELEDVEHGDGSEAPGAPSAKASGHSDDV